MFLWLFLFFFFCMLGYAYVSLFSAWHFHFSKPLARSGYLPAVSVLIPARNESSHIVSCLQSILQQEYPSDHLEIICIDDDSTDDTYQKVWQLAQIHPQLRVIRLSPDTGVGASTGKKAALRTGIQYAKGELIVQTDADCQVPVRWIRTMVSYFTPQVGMVAGPVGLMPRASLFERLQALEIAGLGILTGGAIAGKRPHMCNGANLAFRKSVFEAVGGYQGVDHFASGDDEMLMQKVHKHPAYNILFCPNPDAIVRSFALPHWKDFVSQRIRWVSKAKYYLDRRVNISQLISFLAFLGLALFFFLALWKALSWPYFISLFFLKIGVDIPLMLLAVRFFDQKPLLWLLPLLECVYIPYVLWVGIAGNFSRTYTWKNRTVS